MAKVASQMRFDEKLYEKVKYIADVEYRSVNAQIEYFIKKGIDAYEDMNGKIYDTDIRYHQYSGNSEE